MKQRRQRNSNYYHHSFSTVSDVITRLTAILHNDDIPIVLNENTEFLINILKSGLSKLTLEKSTNILPCDVISNKTSSSAIPIPLSNSNAERSYLNSPQLIRLHGKEEELVTSDYFNILQKHVIVPNSSPIFIKNELLDYISTSVFNVHFTKIIQAKERHNILKKKGATTTAGDPFIELCHNMSRFFAYTSTNEITRELQTQIVNNNYAMNKRSSLILSSSSLSSRVSPLNLFNDEIFIYTAIDFLIDIYNTQPFEPLPTGALQVLSVAANVKYNIGIYIFSLPLTTGRNTVVADSNKLQLQFHCSCSKATHLFSNKEDNNINYAAMYNTLAFQQKLTLYLFTHMGYTFELSLQPVSLEDTEDRFTEIEVNSDLTETFTKLVKPRNASKVPDLVNALEEHNITTVAQVLSLKDMHFLNLSQMTILQRIRKTLNSAKDAAVSPSTSRIPSKLTSNLTAALKVNRTHKKSSVQNELILFLRCIPAFDELQLSTIQFQKIATILISDDIRKWTAFTSLTRDEIYEILEEIFYVNLEKKVDLDELTDAVIVATAQLKGGTKQLDEQFQNIKNLNASTQASCKSIELKLQTVSELQVSFTLFKKRVDCGLIPAPKDFSVWCLNFKIKIGRYWGDLTNVLKVVAISSKAKQAELDHESSSNDDTLNLQQFISIKSAAKPISSSKNVITKSKTKTINNVRATITTGETTIAEDIHMLELNKMLLEQIRNSSSLAFNKARVVCFLGATHAGKSTTISHVVTGSCLPRVATGENFGVPTTAGINLYDTQMWLRTEHGTSKQTNNIMLLDTEGFDAENAGHTVQADLPVVTYLISDVLVFVTKASFAEISTIDKILEKVRPAPEIRTCKPSLIVIYNYADQSLIVNSQSKLTEQFLQKKNVDKLQQYFNDISVFALPERNTETQFLVYLEKIEMLKQLLHAKLQVQINNKRIEKRLYNRIKWCDKCEFVVNNARFKARDFDMDKFKVSNDFCCSFEDSLAVVKAVSFFDSIYNPLKFYHAMERALHYEKCVDYAIKMLGLYMIGDTAVILKQKKDITANYEQSLIAQCSTDDLESEFEEEDEVEDEKQQILSLFTSSLSEQRDRQLVNLLLTELQKYKPCMAAAQRLPDSPQAELCMLTFSEHKDTHESSEIVVQSRTSIMRRAKPTFTQITWDGEFESHTSKKLSDLIAICTEMRQHSMQLFLSDATLHDSTTHFYALLFKTATEAATIQVRPKKSLSNSGGSKQKLAIYSKLDLCAICNTNPCSRKLMWCGHNLCNRCTKILLSLPKQEQKCPLCGERVDTAFFFRLLSYDESQYISSSAITKLLDYFKQFTPEGCLSSLNFRTPLNFNTVLSESQIDHGDERVRIIAVVGRVERSFVLHLQALFKDATLRQKYFIDHPLGPWLACICTAPVGARFANSKLVEGRTVEGQDSSAWRVALPQWRRSSLYWNQPSVSTGGKYVIVHFNIDFDDLQTVNSDSPALLPVLTQTCKAVVWLDNELKLGIGKDLPFSISHSIQHIYGRKQADLLMELDKITIELEKCPVPTTTLNSWCVNTHMKLNSVVSCLKFLRSSPQKQAALIGTKLVARKQFPTIVDFIGKVTVFIRNHKHLLQTQAGGNNEIFFQQFVVNQCLAMFFDICCAPKRIAPYAIIDALNEYWKPCINTITKRIGFNDQDLRLIETSFFTAWQEFTTSVFEYLQSDHSHLLFSWQSVKQSVNFGALLFVTNNYLFAKQLNNSELHTQILQTLYQAAFKQSKGNTCALCYSSKGLQESSCSCNLCIHCAQILQIILEDVEINCFKNEKFVCTPKATSSIISIFLSCPVCGTLDAQRISKYFQNKYYAKLNREKMPSIVTEDTFNLIPFIGKAIDNHQLKPARASLQLADAKFCLTAPQFANYDHAACNFKGTRIARIKFNLKNPVEATKYNRTVGILSIIEHPNILPVLNTESSRTTAYVYYPCIGTTLEEILVTKTTDNSLSFELVLLIAKQVASAIYMLHSIRFEHRNITPSNIFVKFSSNTCVTLLGGLDAGRVFDDSRPATVISTSNSKFLDSLFVAPEIAEVEAHTLASDIYSFGFILRLLVFSLLDLDRDSAFDKSVPLPIEVDKRLVQCITDCMCEDPAKREQDISVVYNLLAGLLQELRQQEVDKPELWPLITKPDSMKLKDKEILNLSKLESKESANNNASSSSTSTVPCTDKEEEESLKSDSFTISEIVSVYSLSLAKQTVLEQFEKLIADPECELALLIQKFVEKFKQKWTISSSIKASEAGIAKIELEIKTFVASITNQALKKHRPLLRVILFEKVHALVASVVLKYFDAALSVKNKYLNAQLLAVNNAAVCSLQKFGVPDALIFEGDEVYAGCIREARHKLQSTPTTPRKMLNAIIHCFFDAQRIAVDTRIANGISDNSFGPDELCPLYQWLLVKLKIENPATFNEYVQRFTVSSSETLALVQDEVILQMESTRMVYVAFVAKVVLFLQNFNLHTFEIADNGVINSFVLASRVMNIVEGNNASIGTKRTILNCVMTCMTAIRHNQEAITACSLAADADFEVITKALAIIKIRGSIIYNEGEDSTLSIIIDNRLPLTVYIDVLYQVRESINTS